MIDAFPTPKRPALVEAWPAMWRESYHYDRLEVWGDAPRMGLGSLAYASSYAARRQRTLQALLAACPPPGRVLDLAAAQGNFTAAAAGLGYRTTWNDLRADMADYVRMKLPDSSAVEFVPQNVFDLGDKHVGRYDAVLALEVIEHVAHPDDFVAKLATLLKPGGALIMSTPNGRYFLNKLPKFSDHPDPSVFESVQFKPNSDGHIFLLYEDEIRRFAETSGLTVERFELFTNSLTAGHVKLRYALRVLPSAVARGIERSTARLPHSLRDRMMAHMLVTLRKPS